MIKGLSDNENRQLQGVLNPSNNILPESRIGDNGALKIQVDYFQDTINNRREQISELNAKDVDKKLILLGFEQETGLLNSASWKRISEDCNNSRNGLNRIY